MPVLVFSFNLTAFAQGSIQLKKKAHTHTKCDPISCLTIQTVPVH